MQAIILAGGYGTRLLSIVSDVPKPMAPIQSKPFLAYLLDRLVEHEFTKVVLAVGHQHQTIIDYFGDKYKTLQLEYSIEEDLLGTGGAIKKAFQYISCDSLFVMNGDTFFEVEYSLMVKQQSLSSSKLVLALRKTTDVSRYGSVIIKDEDIISFQEKGLAGPGLINAGCYLLSKELFTTFDLPDSFSFENHFLHPFVKEIRPKAVISDSYFIDIGIPEDYQRAQIELPTRL